MGVVELAMFHPNGKKVDFFVKYEKGDKSFHFATDRGTSIAYVQPHHHIEKFDTLEMGGESWKIPQDTENYLKTYYGDTWREHISEWDWRCSSPCIDKDFEI